MSDLLSRVVKDFAALPLVAVSTALDRLGLSGHCQGLRSVGAPGASSQGSRLCGRAFTVRLLPCGPRDGRTPNGRLDDYLQDVPPGYVVVLDNRGHDDVAVWTPALSRDAAGQGIAGVVIDGAASVSDADSAVNFPLFAQATCLRSGQDRVRVEGFNLPVEIGGVRVECDDIVLAGANGVLVVPRERAKQVLALARECLSTESQSHVVADSNR